jgi:hypothetical protein
MWGRSTHLTAAAAAAAVMAMVVVVVVLLCRERDAGQAATFKEDINPLAAAPP